VIRELARKEYVERKIMMSIGFTLVLLVTATLPFFFGYSLRHALAQGSNETATLVLRNFRSYAAFIEGQWCARSLPRVLCLLALIGGAGMLAGEREARTWPLLYRSSAPVAAIVGVKYGVLAVWLLAVTLVSALVLAIHGAIAHEPFPLVPIAVTSAIAFATALAFLSVVFAAGAFASRTAFAAALALVAGFAIAGALVPLGFNATALSADVFATDGSIDAARAGVEAGLCLFIAAAGFALAVWRTARRGGT
jgi:ABC-type transport system involved in multi-copper enzyme maturation permease subunit